MSAIRRNVRAARVDIAAETGLSPATVTNITSDLLVSGMIEQVPLYPAATGTKRGRPRVLLRIRGAAHRVIGAKLANGLLTVTLLNFAGDKLAEGEYPMPDWPLVPEALPGLLVPAFEDICARLGYRLRHISGIGLGLPGIIDGPEGRVSWSRALDREDVDLLPLLQERFACPVFLDNDANLVALAELWFGAGRRVRDFITVTLESGLGMGIVIDGALYRGARRRGAEFGHTKVALDGALCSCGQRGCLEAYVSEYALVREAGMLVGEAGGDVLEALHAAARGGDETALEIFRRAGRMFGMGLANVVNIFDPSLIVLSGKSMRFGYLHDAAVLAEMRRNMIQVGDSAPEVQVQTSGDLPWAQGAGALALEGVTETALRALGRAG